ncbi:beta-ketoacyl synthase N-terminal-like domain-containing protein [Micromonospora sp. WMMA1976]|uniref:beta-ketoacyl synthase N-terminal-like domain-containing protein n=1 Tax=Micromonospora sp. WMMA1976 TaxID=3014995 RepID=UPI00248AB8D3|nr:beta-ketoacyl synthase N-terminal-like domain-containing protein [Micromonospora sp. WMMA1976]WBC05540.1 beta-ketoacyl synthase N-terminal-like domain-containing protein [Micromonospora sp. WMMA1976]
MPVEIAASAVRTCFGDGDATFAALLGGRCGVAPLSGYDPAAVHVRHGYPIPDGSGGELWPAAGWLRDCVRRALADAALDPARHRVAALVGTGLRELRAVERAVADRAPFRAGGLHFRSAVADAGVPGAVTVANACSAGGHVLALAQDMIELGEADAVVVAATDAMTESMLAMIGRVADEPADRVRPFDRDRAGVLLGEGAAALVVTRAGLAPRVLARVVATGLSCDAYHETAPSAEGVRRAMDDAYARGAREPADASLVVAHGTGTALNDPTEAAALVALGGPTTVTGLKGAIGHTSGTAALHGLDVAVRCLRAGVVPPIAGLRTPLPGAEGLDLVRDRPARTRATLAQVNAFGFGGVNAVTLVEAAR